MKSQRNRRNHLILGCF